MKETLMNVLDKIKNFFASLDYRKVLVAFIILIIVGFIGYKIWHAFNGVELNSDSREEIENSVIPTDLYYVAERYAALEGARLPKENGDIVEITVAELKNAGLLNENSINAKTYKPIENDDFVVVISKYDDSYLYDIRYTN